ncbi:MAG: hypothetical protein PHO10_02490 [Gemmiger sp.]|nr:hypothetical protein [Gemmiger sp.]
MQGSATSLPTGTGKPTPATPFLPRRLPVETGLAVLLGVLAAFSGPPALQGIGPALAGLLLTLPVLWLERALLAEVAAALKKRTLPPMLPAVLGAVACLCYGLYTLCRVGMGGSGSGWGLCWFTACGLLVAAGWGQWGFAALARCAAPPDAQNLAQNTEQNFEQISEQISGQNSEQAPEQNAEQNSAQPGEATPLTAQANRFAAQLTRAALVVALLVFVAAVAAGAGVGVATSRAVAVLAIACPLALLLAAPLATAAARSAGVAGGARFKNAAALVALAATTDLLVAPEGALTAGEPHVVGVIGTRKVPAKFLLGLAAGLEAPPESAAEGGGHNVFARAVLARAAEEGVAIRPLAGLATHPGGRTGTVAGKVVAGGDANFIATQCPLPAELLDATTAMAAQGATAYYFSLDRHAAGAICISDVVKPASKPAIAALGALGLQVALVAPAAAHETTAHIANLVGLGENGTADADRAAALASAGTTALAAAPAHGWLPMPATPALKIAVGLLPGDALPGAEDALPGAEAAQFAQEAGLVLPRGDLADLPYAITLARHTLAALRHSWRVIAACQLLLLVVAGLALTPVAAALLGWLAGLWVCHRLVNTLRNFKTSDMAPNSQDSQNGQHGQNGPDTKSGPDTTSTPDAKSGPDSLTSPDGPIGPGSAATFAL